MTAVSILLRGRWLVVSFDEPHEARGWASYGGPMRRTKRVAWYQVQEGDLNSSVDASEFVKKLFVLHDLEDAVGMLTGASLMRYVDVEQRDEDLSVRSIATVGMGNALRVGDPPSEGFRVGTINLLCAISAPLTENAFLEAMSIVVEARTLGVLESGIPSNQTGFPATGTGTDCVVVAAPAQSVLPPLEYAGKHTRVGSLMGQSVLEAVRAGLRRCDLKIGKKGVLI